MRYPFRHATLLDPAQAELQVRHEVLEDPGTGAPLPLNSQSITEESTS
jgi:hypothetical protein